ncbi:TetR/AcrR family transcriptional regulator [uncultured Corynebacterium sp.]|uniref:TetR/AcrR family transcriptional regulator n=1 Tax=uncultured Corynebacterium sp. TaxID=159447 RepID=UPI0026002273|nr:TetR/AcrR family transcriptional regulator [uncultured Corynebacterium sp.]
MGRPSNKTALIEAALQIIEESGVRALTYQSLSEHTGKSRSGLLYHFPSKEAMVEAAHEHAVHKWNDVAEGSLPGDFDSATAEERALAYITATVEEQSAAGGGCYRYGVHDSFDEGVWRTIRDRWIDFTEGALTPAQHVALLAADGLWLEHGPDRRLSEASRRLIIDQLMALVRSGDGRG